LSGGRRWRLPAAAFGPH